MIPNEEKEGWHYLAVKTIYIIKMNNIKTSLRFLLLELSSFKTENKLKSEMYAKNAHQK